MTLDKIFAQSGITHAHIVDDAYDPAPTDRNSDAEIRQFLDGMMEDEFDALAEFLEVEADEAAVLDALSDIMNVQRLFKARRRFPKARTLFADFLRNRKDRQAKIQPLLKRLRECGVHCHTYGPGKPKVGKHPPQLIFIDLQLRNAGGITIEDALKEYRRIVKKYPKAKPFVFLFSTLASSLEEHKAEFREKAKLFISQFEALEKARLSEPDELDLVLRSYASALPRLREMHDAIDHVSSAVETARAKLTDTLLALDLVDYFVLHANTVSIEKSKLGTYVSEILMEYLTHEVEQADGFWKFAEVLDSWSLNDIPRARFGFARPVRTIYSGNMLHAPNRLKSEEEREIAPKQGYFALGDIFFKKSELDSDAPKTALVIATPACDLARPDELINRTILLCSGKISKVKEFTLPTGEHGTAAVVIDHPKKQKQQLLIEWDKKKLRTWHAEEMETFQKDASDWVRVGRLRPLYALQLQHSIATDLSRIGVQRTPSLLSPHGLSVFVRDGNVWRTLDNGDANNPSAAAMSVTEDKKKKPVFIVTDVAAFRIFRALKQWALSHPKSATHDEIEKFCLLPDALLSLLYVEQPPNKEKAFDKVCYPAMGKAGLTNDRCVAYIRPNAGSPYDSVTNKQAAKEDQHACILFKFQRIGN